MQGAEGNDKEWNGRDWNGKDWIGMVLNLFARSTPVTTRSRKVLDAR
jgi:hypothetical protein